MVITSEIEKQEKTRKTPDSRRFSLNKSERILHLRSLFHAGKGIRTLVGCPKWFSSSREYVESSGTTWNLVELYGI